MMRDNKMDKMRRPLQFVEPANFDNCCAFHFHWEIDIEQNKNLFIRTAAELPSSLAALGLLLLRWSGTSFFSAATSARPCFYVCVKKLSLLAAAAGASLQIVSTVASALLLKPAAGTPVPGKGVVTCKFPADPTVALGYLSLAFLIVSTVAGYMSLYYPYKGKSVSQGEH
ncbi:hypothetical protein PIB30_086596 [Stylosanthes scabra]|uniref:CASP-like protein n=1 Tax=Stylosanthes scabra TaxID=79078 RepID=A0ABU6TSP9_9FABA|nr:hypothetical protein [Stylosanthes scabra]